MSVASLTRFTVPVPGVTQSQGLLMPKLKYRFRVIFENFGVTTQRTELTKQVVSAARPTVTFDDITLDTYNSRIKLAGKPTWNDVSITIRDDALGFVTMLIGEQLQKQFDFFDQSSAQAGIVYKFTTKIEMLDGGNGEDTAKVLETWALYGCYLQSVNYSELNYSESAAVEIQMDLRFDNALQIPLESGVGKQFTRGEGSVTTG